MNDLPKTNQCHKCKEWFHTVHVCASDVKVMPKGCITATGCREHGCHGECLNDEGPTMNNERDCKHGQLARSCEICGLEAEVERLDLVAKAAGTTAAEFMRERDALKAELAAMREQEPAAFFIPARVDVFGKVHYWEQVLDKTKTPLYAAPGASPQPSQARELSDDPLQGAVDWFLLADGEFFCVATVQRTLRIGYNRAQRLCDKAKERAAINAKGAT